MSTTRRATRPRSRSTRPKRLPPPTARPAQPMRPKAAARRAASGCQFMWPFNVDDAGMLKDTPYNDTLGICIALAHYQYDSNGDGTLDTTLPDCKTLPPRSAATTGKFDDAADWGCQKVANSMMVGADGKKVHPAQPGAPRPALPAPPAARGDPRSAHARLVTSGDSLTGRPFGVGLFAFSATLESCNRQPSACWIMCRQ